MKFSLMFYLVSELTFTVDFLLTNTTTDLFLFNGDNAAAHLHVLNGTAYLQIFRGEGHISWQKTVSKQVVRFSWPNMINGERMDLTYNDTTVQGIEFNEFVFLNPFLIAPKANMLHIFYVMVILLTLAIYFIIWNYYK